MISSYRSTLSAKKWVCDTMCLTLKFNSENFLILPGQFINVLLPDKIARPYSVADVRKVSEESYELDLYIEYIEGGKGSEYLKSKELGDEILFMAPFGRFLPSFINLKGEVIKQIADTTIYYICTGSGIVPLYSMFKSMYDHVSQTGYYRFPAEVDLSKIKIKVFYGMKYLCDVYLYEEMQELKKKLEAHNISAEIHLWLSREENSKYDKIGRVYKGLDDETFDPKSEFYISGSKQMVEDVKKYLVDHGIDINNIRVERYN